MKKITTILKKTLLLSGAFFLFDVAVAQSTVKAIKAGKLVDVIAGKVLENQIILIDGDKITQVGAYIAIPKNVEIIDLSNATVLPGLIDCHTHLTVQPGENYYDDIFRKTATDWAIEGTVYARKTLEAGFTMVRDAGSDQLVDVSLRDAINKGTIPGPRMLVSTFPIGSTGGHVDLTGFNPNLDFKGNKDFTGVADGVDEIRKRVRNNVKWGADWIKFMASGGVLSEEETPGLPQYSFEEMKAICDEAHRWGKKAMAHAHGTEAIKMAIKAGVSSIEHGSLIDDEGIALMKQYGVYLVPTIYCGEYVVAEYGHKGFPKKIINKAILIDKQRDENFKKAVKAGVKIAFGTDAAVYPHGWNGKEFYRMTQIGFTPMQAIQAATINAATLLSWDVQVGSISNGKLADIIAVKGNPLDDVRILENVAFVMKEGKVYKNIFEK